LSRISNIPTGLRRLTPALLQANRAAESFAGLPGDVTHAQILAAFKAAAPSLGIAPRLIHAVDWLFCFTQPQDWRKDSRPIVWPSSCLQQESLSLSRTQVRATNNQLIELGLIAVRDSPSGQRFGRRDPRGRIVEAYGFDLSPLAVRYSEFTRLAEAAKAERALRGRLRRRVTIARKAIRQISETAIEYGLAGEEWDLLATDTAGLVRQARTAELIADLEDTAIALERRQAVARERLEGVLKSVETVPSHRLERPPYYSYKATSYLEKTTVAAFEESRSSPDERRDADADQTIAPDELVRLAPRLRPYLLRPTPTWPELVDAADWLRHDLGISRPLWGEACVAMGRELAAVALAIVSTKEPGHFRTTPGGYFHGMVSRARAGELHLDRTVWALRLRANSASPDAGGDHA
jgi:replication initiation protein RepC